MYVMESVFKMYALDTRTKSVKKEEDNSRKLMSTKFYHLETNEVAVTKN